MLHILATLFFLACLAGSAACLWLAVREDLPLIKAALGYRAGPARTTGSSTKLAASGAKWMRWAAAR